MQKITFIQHTADIRMKVEADSLTNLFCGALAGMNRLLLADNVAGGEIFIEQELKLSAIDFTALIIDFLSEILSLSYEKNSIFKISEINVANNSLVAKMQGKKIKSFQEDIKAVTYHEARVNKNKAGNYETMIIFDI